MNKNVFNSREVFNESINYGLLSFIHRPAIVAEVILLVANSYKWRSKYSISIKVKHCGSSTTHFGVTALFDF